MTTAEILVARQLRIVGRRHGLGLNQANWCREKLKGFRDLEYAATALRRRAARRPFVGGQVAA